MLQLLMLRPRVAILDEIDSGLDVDALKAVARGIAHARERDPQMSVVVITHYQRILQHLSVDAVHVMHNGQLTVSGDAQLARTIDAQGYDGYR